MVIRPLFLFSLALLLSACGSSGNDTPPPPTGGGASLNIDTANALPAVRVAYGATAQSVDTGGLLEDSGVASSPEGSFAKLTHSIEAPGFVVRFMQKDPLGPFVENCQSSGTTTLNLDVNPITFAAGELSTGDQISVDFAECDHGLGEVTNGSMIFTVANYLGDLASGSYRLEMDVLLIDFVVATATDTVTSNGDSTVTIDTTGDPMVLLSISGNSLSSVSAGNSETVTNFLTTQTLDTSTIPEPYTLNSTGTVDSSQLAGVIEFETPVTFQGMGAAYPFAGELLVTGINSAVKLIALTDTTVRIETDSDGDGIFESAEETTWDDIAL